MGRRLADAAAAASAPAPSNRMQAAPPAAGLLHRSKSERPVFDAAAAAWRAVLQLDPDHIVAKTRLDECEIKLMA